MTPEDRRRELELQIADLSRTYRATPEPAATAIAAQIGELRDAVDLINRDAGRQLAERIDGILRNLENVRTRNGLDAASALGRSIEKLRGFVTQL